MESIFKGTTLIEDNCIHQCFEEEECLAQNPKLREAIGVRRNFVKNDQISVLNSRKTAMLYNNYIDVK